MPLPTQHLLGHDSTFSDPKEIESAKIVLVHGAMFLVESDDLRNGGAVS